MICNLLLPKSSYTTLLIAMAFYSCSEINSKNESEQETVTATQKFDFDISSSCNYTGHFEKTVNDEPIYTFNSDKEASEAVKKIMNYTGLAPNFDVLATDWGNAAAVIKDNKRYILYSQKFMIEARLKTKTDYGPISILAHEIGHHLSGHTLMKGGSRPELELDADRFSGFVLAKMGASIEEACAAINSYSNEEGSSTHPSRKSREAAIINGWKSAMENPAPPKVVGNPLSIKDSRMYKVDVLRGYITLRNRSLSATEIKIANSGSEKAKIINKETIITNLYNGTIVELLGQTGIHYQVRTMIDNKYIDGYIVKSFNGTPTIRINK